MTRTIILCADKESLAHPALIGLDDEPINELPWLLTHWDAAAVRNYVRNHNDLDEVWVISSETIDGINLAAAIKKDEPNLQVRYVAFDGSGSLLSRCDAAGVQALFGATEFQRTFRRAKLEALGVQTSFAITSSKKRHATDPDNSSLEPEVEENTFSAELPYPTDRADSSTFPFIALSANDETAGGDGQTSDPASSTSLSNIVQSLAHKENTSFTLNYSDPAAGATVPPEIDALPWTHELNVTAQPEEHDAFIPIAPKQPTTAQAITQEMPIIPSDSPRATEVIQPTHIQLLSPKTALQTHMASFIGQDAQGIAMNVVSGSGGSGKSTFAVIAGILLQKAGLKTVIVDADLQFGDMRLLLNQEAALNFADVLSAPERLADLQPQDFIPALIACPAMLEESETLAAHVGPLVQALKLHFDAIVINTGSHWSEEHAQLLEVCDRSVFLIDQRPSSVRGCKRALAFCGRAGIAQQCFSFALNRVSKQAPLTAVDVTCALQGEKVHELKDGGREVAEFMGASLPLDLIETRNFFVESVASYLDFLVPAYSNPYTGTKAPKRRLPIRRRS